MRDAEDIDDPPSPPPPTAAPVPVQPDSEAPPAAAVAASHQGIHFHFNLNHNDASIPSLLGQLLAGSSAPATPTPTPTQVTPATPPVDLNGTAGVDLAGKLLAILNTNTRPTPYPVQTRRRGRPSRLDTLIAQLGHSSAQSQSQLPGPNTGLQMLLTAALGAGATPPSSPAPNVAPGRGTTTSSAALGAANSTTTNTSTAGNSSTQLSCVLCYSQSFDQVLPCRHTLCTPCLENLGRNRASFNCPDPHCRRTCAVSAVLSLKHL